jgi:hypothetical protein
MICDLDLPYAASTHNGHGRAVARADKEPERTGWELLGWAILEQAVDDLALFCRWGIVTQTGKCLPWPREVKSRVKWTRRGPERYVQSVPRTIASSKGPNDHHQLCAWFRSPDAQTFCDLIGCNLRPEEIFRATVKNHGGLNHAA